MVHRFVSHSNSTKCQGARVEKEGGKGEMAAIFTWWSYLIIDMLKAQMYKDFFFSNECYRKK